MQFELENEFVGSTDFDLRILINSGIEYDITFVTKEEDAYK